MYWGSLAASENCFRQLPGSNVKLGSSCVPPQVQDSKLTELATHLVRQLIYYLVQVIERGSSHTMRPRWDKRESKLDNEIPRRFGFDSLPRVSDFNGTKDLKGTVQSDKESGESELHGWRKSWRGGRGRKRTGEKADYVC